MSKFEKLLSNIEASAEDIEIAKEWFSEYIELQEATLFIDDSDINQENLKRLIECYTK